MDFCLVSVIYHIRKILSFLNAEYPPLDITRPKQDNFKSLYGLGGRCLKIRDVCMDFEPNFNVHNFISKDRLRACNVM